MGDQMKDSNRVVMIPVNKISPPTFEMRETMTHEGLEELRDSIKEIGLRQAITVKPVGDCYEIVAGARRFECVRLLGWEEVPCCVDSVTDEVCEIIKIHENLKREEVDPIEESAYYARLVKEKGWDLDRLAAATGKGFAYLERRIEMHGWDDRIKDAVKAKVINLSVALELMKFKDSEARERYLVAAGNNGVTARTMESWRLQYEADLVNGVPGSGLDPVTHGKTDRYIAKTFCEVCGEDLHGKITYYVPISQVCKDVLAQARANGGNNEPRIA